MAHPHVTKRSAGIRVLRVYHSGRDPEHRGRERALVEAGVDVTLVVPAAWPDAGAERELSPEAFRVVELAVRRAGDVNRHAYLDGSAMRRLIDEARPDVIDIHEEPFSVAAHQWLRAARGRAPIVMYAAQNVDKRYPPPFLRYEQSAYGRVAAVYPCSRQAASVLRGKGFGGEIRVLGLGYDDTVFHPGAQSVTADEVVLALVGRLVPEKGLADAVGTLARIQAVRPARLVVCGSGPDGGRVHELARSLGVADRLDLRPWQTVSELASLFRTAHVVLVPSVATETWVEQFGRVIVEAQASGAVVAGYATGAIPEVAGAAGIIVPAGDIEQLAAGVARVVADPNEFAWRRDEGRRQAATRTWRAVAELQVGLYRAAHAHELAPVTLPRSPRKRRTAAHAEFGPTAATLRGMRPFALPGLRRGGPVARVLAAVIDAMVELKATVSRVSAPRGGRDGYVRTHYARTTSRASVAICWPMASHVMPRTWSSALLESRALKSV